MGSAGSLTIDISANAQQASSALDNLAKSAGNVGTALTALKQNGGSLSSEFKSLADGISAVATASQNLDAGRITSFSKALSSLGGTNLSSISSSLPKVASAIQNTVSQLNSINVSGSVASLVTALGQIASSADGLNAVADAFYTVSVNAQEAEEDARYAAEAIREAADAQKSLNNSSNGNASKGATEAGEAAEESGAKAGNASGQWKALFGIMKKVNFGFGNASGGVKNFTSSLKGGFNTVLRYVFGIRSLFVLLNKIRAAFKVGSGNLQHYSSAYNSAVVSMANALAQLKNASAAALSPIVQALSGPITSLINMFTDACNAIGRFWAALTGGKFAVQATKTYDAVADAASSAGSAAGDAAGAIEDLLGLQGFDKLNNLNSSDSGSGSGGSGGSGGGGSSYEAMFETVDTSDMNGLVSKLKECWEKADFSFFGTLFSDKISDGLESIDWNSSKGIKSVANKIAKSIATFLTGGEDGEGFINPRLFGDVGTTIAEALNTGVSFVNVFNQTINTEQLSDSFAAAVNNFLTTFDWSKCGQAIHSCIKNLRDTIMGTISKISFKDLLSGIADMLGEISLGDIVFAIGLPLMFKLGGALVALSALQSTLLGMIRGALGIAGAGTGAGAVATSGVATMWAIYIPLLTICFTELKLEDDLEDRVQQLLNGEAEKAGASSNTTINGNSYVGKTGNTNSSAADEIYQGAGYKFGTWLNNLGFGQSTSYYKQQTPAESYTSQFTNGVTNAQNFLSQLDLSSLFGSLNDSDLELPTCCVLESWTKGDGWVDSINFTAWLTEQIDKLKSHDLNFNSIITSFKDSIKTSKIVSGFKSKLTSFADAISQSKIVTGFKSKLTSFLDSISANDKTLGGFKSRITSFMDSITSGKTISSFKAKFTSKDTSDLDKTISGFKATISSFSLTQTASTWLSNLKNLKINATVTKNGKASGGIYAGGRWHGIETYANGGYPGGSQMFIAREAGPELVGTIGNHTAVVNNDQIVASISDGVYRATKAAMSGGNQNVTVVLEGDADGIFRVVRKADRRYKNMTGNSAFAY